MRVVVQRVKKALVKVREEIISQIGPGLLVFLAVKEDDTEEDIKWLANKIINLRIFPDDNNKMNKSIKDIDGEILVVSQFTLYGDCYKGNRPSFIKSANLEKAEDFYKKFIYSLEEARQILSLKSKSPIQTGRFQEQMKVELINEGPVTIIIDSKER